MVEALGEPSPQVCRNPKPTKRVKRLNWKVPGFWFNSKRVHYNCRCPLGGAHIGIVVGRVRISTAALVQIMWSSHASEGEQVFAPVPVDEALLLVIRTELGVRIFGKVSMI